MKQLIILFIVVTSILNLKAQDSVQNNWDLKLSDRFNDVHCPIPDGYSMWMMRQNMIVKGTQTVLEANSLYNFDNKLASPEYRVETYLPVISSKKVNSLIGARYWRMSMLEPRIKIDNTIQFLWLWTTLQYKPGEKWNLILSTELYQKGNRETFLEKTGNYMFSIFYCGYALGSHWQLIGFGGFERIFKYSKEETKPVMALQLKYIPNSNLKLMTGMPVIFAAEWSASKRIDLAGYCWYNMKNAAFIRYHLKRNIGLSLIYNGTDMKSANMFSENKNISINNKNFVFNNIYQLQHRLSLELGMKLTKNTSIQLRTGYIFKSTTRFKLDDKNQYYTDVATGWISGISFYLLNFSE